VISIILLCFAVIFLGTGLWFLSSVTLGAQKSAMVAINSITDVYNQMSKMKDDDLYQLRHINHLYSEIMELKKQITAAMAANQTEEK
jgi:hypothetical protein